MSNTGDRNTGNWNTGHRNTGNWNTGHWNTGHRNTGNWNTGNWNTGDRNTGMFNTDEPTVRMFNRDTDLKRNEIDVPSWLYFDIIEWVCSTEMTDAEKSSHPSYKTTGGYLRSYEYKEAFRKAFDAAPLDERKKVMDLPNFDADIFLEISGIDVRKEFAEKHVITIDGKDIELSAESYAALKEQLA